MLIRDEQMEELRKAPLRAFEDEMVAHLAEFSPPLFKAVKENQMRVVICLGIARAGKYGITFRGPIRFYLELMLLFGSHFDTDPQYPWAAEILRDSAPQMSRAERLYERTLDYRKNVGGPKDAHALQALRNIRVLVDQPLTVSSDNFSSAILEAMTRVYPQKKAYVGENGLRVLIDAGIVAAQKYGFSSIRALALPVGDTSRKGNLRTLRENYYPANWRKRRDRHPTDDPKWPTSECPTTRSELHAAGLRTRLPAVELFSPAIRVVTPLWRCDLISAIRAHIQADTGFPASRAKAQRA
jgi:hypothetical protein